MMKRRIHYYGIDGEIGNADFHVAITLESAEVLKAHLTHPGFLMLKGIRGEEVLIRPGCVKLIRETYYDMEEDDEDNK